MTENLGVKEAISTEFWVGPTQVTLMDGDTLNVKAMGPQTYETAMAHLKIFEHFYEQVNKPLKFLIDLNDAGKNSAEARKVWKDISEHEYTSKVALVGIHPVARVIAGFVMSISTSNKIKFFSTREKALKWFYE